MTGKISRRVGDDYTSIDLDELSAAKINWLGQEAYSRLSKQDANHWHKVGAIGVLPRLMEGAIVLQRLGERSGRPLLLDDDGAHLAFMTCCFVSLKTKKLGGEMRSILEQVIRLLADCCHVDTSLIALPPLRRLPKDLQQDREIRRQYQLWKKPGCGPSEVSLADALILLQIYQAAGRPEDLGMIHELMKTTEGLRMALHRIHSA